MLREREWQAAGSAGDADLDRLFALDQECFHPGVAYTRAELAAFLEHPSAFSVMVESAPTRFSRTRELFGFAIGRSLRHRGRPTFHLVTIDVSPAARRQGVGTRLMRWMIAKAKELRAEALRLEVAVDNADAIGFYVRFGFREVGRIPGYYLGRIDALTMELSLSSSPRVHAEAETGSER